MVTLRPVLATLLFTFVGCTHGAADTAQPPTAASAGVATAGATAEPAPHDLSTTPSDLAVTERIRTLFAEDTELAHVERRVTIATEHQVVTLTGSVATDRQRLVMAAHARAVEGVTHLDNRIALAP